MTDAATADKEPDEGLNKGPEAASAGGSESEPADRIDHVLAELRGLRADFDAKLRYDEVQEQRVQAMAIELEEHRRGLYQQLVLPLVNDVVALHDDLTKLLDSAESDDLAKTLAFLRESVEEALHRNGVTDFIVTGDVIDRTRQKIVEVIQTGEPALDRQVARRLRRGFELDGRVLRPEWVAVYRFESVDIVETAGIVETIESIEGIESIESARKVNGEDTVDE